MEAIPGGGYAHPDDDSAFPVRSPDGSQILFARGSYENNRQLYMVYTDGTNLIQVTNLPYLQGRSDWSQDGRTIGTDAGEGWIGEIYIMGLDGSNLQQITQGGDNAYPSFSPDGNWITFTSDKDKPGDEYGCEIYIIRIDGTDIRRLSSNDYCDWQPSWGK